MQLNPCYLYPNKIDVYTNLESWTDRRQRKVYQRTFKTYRGCDNRLDLQVRNGDEKPRNISGYTAVFNIVVIDSNELILQKDCEILDATTGKIYVRITETEMLTLTQGSYLFSVYLQDANGVKTPLYGDSQYGAIGRLEVVADMVGGPVASQTINTFSYLGPDIHGDPTDVYFSEIVDAKPQFNNNSGLHTFAFYMTNYSGVVTIQGTLENSDNIFDWCDVETINFNDSGIAYANITGIWSRLRIKHMPTLDRFGNPLGTIDKVLYRY